MKSENTIRVRLFGGLGNQLFQYFAGMEAAYLNKSILEFDFRWMKEEYSHVNSDIRDFNFFENSIVISENSNEKLNFTIEKMKTKIASKIGIFQSVFRINVPPKIGYVDLSNIKDGYELRGYYQSAKYFHKLQNMHGDFNFGLMNPTSHFKELQMKLEAVDFIAIHVRGGDYRMKSRFYLQLGEDYYFKALSRIVEELNISRIIVFTDDTPYAKNLLNLPYSFEFLDQKDLRASESMLIMGLAKGIIISNSTFSYWAAILPNCNYVKAPKQWFVKIPIESDMYPTSWELI